MRKLQNKNHHKIIPIITLFIIIAAQALPLTNAQTNESYDKHFEWDYKGQHWTWNISIPEQLYQTYKNVPVSTRTHDGPAGYGFLTTTQDRYVILLAEKLSNTAAEQNYNTFDKASFTLAFVQSLPYTSDTVTAGHDEYPRFPIETLVDDGGDCEDTSILFATLSLIMGFGTVYINPPGHYAVGILGNELRGTYWTYPEGSNQTYYYCETTGSGFMIGDMPYQFQGKSASIYTIDESKQFIPQKVIDSTESVSKPTPKPSQDNIAQPSSEPIFPPISIEIIYNNPLLYILGVFSAVVIAGLVFMALKHKPEPIPTGKTTQTNNIQAKINKFCIFCGTKNKEIATFCEKCGKNIT